MSAGVWRSSGRYLWGYYRATAADPLAQIGSAFVEQLGPDMFSVWVAGASGEWVRLPSMEEAMQFAETTLALVIGGE